MLTRYRQALVQVKLCNPCLSALSVRYYKKERYISILTYAYRPPASCLHCTPILSCCLYCAPCASFISCFTPLLRVFLGLPLLLCPCRRTLLVILLLGLLNVCLLHVHLLLVSKISADSCFAAFHESSSLSLLS